MEISVVLLEALKYIVVVVVSLGIPCFRTSAGSRFEFNSIVTSIASARIHTAAAVDVMHD